MTSKKAKERKDRIRKLDKALKKLYPRAAIELNFTNPLELLVAVQLSAQCTDKMVNRVTSPLFKRYRTLDDYVAASASRRTIAEFEALVRSCGYYRQKTKNILAAATMIKREFGGAVPKTIGEMLRLPGVARKTATVVLKEAYGVVAGITVDTHVIRFVRRYDLSDFKDPVRIERDLMRVVPKKEWGTFTHRVIPYGRYLAPARKYDTTKDTLVKLYPLASKIFR
ncbi:MAG: endonuclease III, partial [Patescibacteria group bacterium]